MKNFIFIFLCLAISLCFLGCKKDAIQFRRESKFSEAMDNIQQNKPSVKRSSGVVIYQDKSGTPSSNNNSFNHDINFDLPMKIK